MTNDFRVRLRIKSLTPHQRRPVVSAALKLPNIDTPPELLRKLTASVKPLWAQPDYVGQPPSQDVTFYYQEPVHRSLFVNGDRGFGR